MATVDTPKSVLKRTTERLEINEEKFLKTEFVIDIAFLAKLGNPKKQGVLLFRRNLFSLGQMCIESTMGNE